jgi:hypothetical protein
MEMLDQYGGIQMVIVLVLGLVYGAMMQDKSS